MGQTSSIAATARLKILIVEDEWLIGEDLKDQLERLGHEVMGPALNCAAAIELIFRDRPDLAVVDTHLGSEICEVVLDELALQEVPVLICSGHGKADLPLFAQPFPLLSKPYTGRTVEEALAARLS